MSRIALIDGDAIAPTRRYVWERGTRTNQHVGVVEAILGYKLPKGVIVHHVDNDGTNNHPSNLVVCPSQKYHLLLHARQRIYEAGGDCNFQAICGHCQEVKNRSEFCGSKSHWHGISSTCRSCASLSKEQRGWNVHKNRPNMWKDNLGQQYRRVKVEKISWL